MDALNCSSSINTCAYCGFRVSQQGYTDISRDEVSFLTNEVRRVVGYLPTERFLVMTKESMAVMIEPGKTLEDCVGQCEVETGRLLNAEWIITGEL